MLRERRHEFSEVDNLDRVLHRRVVLTNHRELVSSSALEIELKFGDARRQLVCSSRHRDR